MRVLEIMISLGGLSYHEASNKRNYRKQYYEYKFWTNTFSILSFKEITWFVLYMKSILRELNKHWVKERNSIASGVYDLRFDFSIIIKQIGFLAIFFFGLLVRGQSVNNKTLTRCLSFLAHRFQSDLSRLQTHFILRYRVKHYWMFPSLFIHNEVPYLGILDKPK
jgi:hypothetical protein